MLAFASSGVLLVEDNPGDVTLIRQCLGDTTTIELVDVPNAVQANLHLHCKPPFEDAPTPDLVLLDLRLPIFDGSSVLQSIRATERLAHLPVVVLSSSMLPSDQKRCQQLGATDYVMKPSDWDTWLLTIQRILLTHLHRG